MNELRQFILEHSERGECKCGKCCDSMIGPDDKPKEHSADLVFFTVSATGDPSPDELRRLISESKHGAHCDVDPLDGAEHNYLELGGWLDDQGMALMLMGLGSILGLWKLFTPRMLGLPEDLVQRMAGGGMVSITARGA